MAFEYLQSLSLSVVFGLLVVILAAATEAGNWIGRTYGQERANDKHAGTLATTVLGLLALLIAFTYSMALSRYDLRRQVVLEEANAIGSTVNFALMLPQADQAPIIADLKGYTNLRINLGAPYDPAKLDADIKRSGELRDDLWKRAVAISAAEPQSLPGYRFIASLNEMNNMGEKRITALRNHVPVVISFMLGGTALVAMGFAGYGAGVSGAKRRYAHAIMTVLIAALITLMLDLQRPDRGTIEVPTRPLEDTLAAFPPG